MHCTGKRASDAEEGDEMRVAVVGLGGGPALT
jgi:hypothetical protein